MMVGERIHLDAFERVQILARKKLDVDCSMSSFCFLPISMRKGGFFKVETSQSGYGRVA